MQPSALAIVPVDARVFDWLTWFNLVGGEGCACWSAASVGVLMLHLAMSVTFLCFYLGRRNLCRARRPVTYGFHRPVF